MIRLGKIFKFVGINISPKEATLSELDIEVEKNDIDRKIKEEFGEPKFRLDINHKK